MVSATFLVVKKIAPCDFLDYKQNIV